METIKQAAVKCNDKIYTLPRPFRHADIFNHIYKECPEDLRCKEDGFLTDADRFVDRHEAALIAFNANQIISDDFTLAALYTEDIF